MKPFSSFGSIRQDIHFLDSHLDLNFLYMALIDISFLRADSTTNISQTLQCAQCRETTNVREGDVTLTSGCTE